MSPLGAGTVWVGAAALACLGLPGGLLRLAGAPSVAVVLALGLGVLAYGALLWVGRERVQLSALVRTLRRGGRAR